MKLAELDSLRGEVTCSVEVASRAYGIGRGKGYQLARAGQLPGVLRLGRRYVVSVPALLRALGVDGRVDGSDELQP